MDGPSVRSRAISGALRLGVRPLLQYLPGHTSSIRTARSTVEAASMLLRPGAGVQVEAFSDPHPDDDTGDRPLKGEWVIPRDAREQRRRRAKGAVLYLHGGGYIACSPRTHRPITARLALDTGLPVLAPRYRLAPEHPFPAPLEDAVAAYRWLLASGVPPSRIVLAGDSAGGHLAAVLTGEICRLDLPIPAGVVLFSPWIDLTCKLSIQAQNSARDPCISAASAQRIARLVVGPAGFDDPRLALLTCAWTDIPPVLIQVGGTELLRTEAEEFAAALRRSGGDCDLQVWDGQMHVFQILNRVLPEADAAMSEAARFIGSVTAGSASRRSGARGKSSSRRKTQAA